MILFVVDQVAGAEYLLPLLARWSVNPPEAWRLIAASRACAVLARAGIVHEPTADIDLPHALALLEKSPPRIGVLSSSGDSGLERAFRSALRQLRIPCYQFIDIWANYALRFRAGEDKTQLDFPDAVLTIDSAAREAMITEGIPANIINVIGQPYFEARRTELHAQPVAPERPGRVLIATQPVAHYHGRSLGYDEHDFLRCCLDAWQQRAADWERIDVAIHPEQPRDAHAATLARYSGRIRVIENPGMQIRNYTVVLSMFSSLLVQAFLAGIPAASIQPGAGTDDICHLSAQGLIPRWTQVA